MTVSVEKEARSASLPCAASLAYQVLTDFSRYFEWLDFLTGSRVLAREGDLAISEFLVRPPYSKLVVESIHSENELVVVRRISGEDPFREMTWKLRSEGQRKCSVSVALSAPLGLVGILRRQPRYWTSGGLLQALESRVRVLSGDLGSDVPFLPIVDISETEQGSVLWFQGKQYSLNPLVEDTDDPVGD